MNFAKEVKGMKTIRYLCSDCGIFCNGRENTFASFDNVQFNKPVT